MGQQQIFFILVVTVIAGIATIVAINTLQESRVQSNVDAVKLEMLRVVPTAAAFFEKPSALGGGGGSFQNIRMADILLDSTNENGTYSIKNRQTEFFILEGAPKSDNQTLELKVTDTGAEWVNN